MGVLDFQISLEKLKQATMDGSIFPQFPGSLEVVLTCQTLLSICFHGPSPDQEGIEQIE